MMLATLCGLRRGVSSELVEFGHRSDVQVERGYASA